MADQGPKIPQGLVLFVLGTPKTTSDGSYRRRKVTTFQSNDRHGALVTLPTSYKGALEVALRYFGAQLAVEKVEDLVLKRAISTSHSFGGVVFAEFDAEDWDTVMVGPELEIGVFKSALAEVAPEVTAFEPDYVPCPAPAPFPAPMSNPWLNNSFAYNPINYNYNPTPTPNKDKSVQLTHVTTTEQDALATGKGLETALVTLPETYEECERVAREVFNPPTGSKMTMKVATIPTGIYSYTDYGNSSSWTIVHKSAYATSILSYNGAFEIRVEFTGGSVDVDSKTTEGSSDTFLML